MLTWLYGSMFALTFLGAYIGTTILNKVFEWLSLSVSVSFWEGYLFFWGLWAIYIIMKLIKSFFPVEKPHQFDIYLPPHPAFQGGENEREEMEGRDDRDNPRNT